MEEELSNNKDIFGIGAKQMTEKDRQTSVVIYTLLSNQKVTKERKSIYFDCYKAKRV